MASLIWIIGLFIAAFGIGVVLRPRILGDVVRFCKKTPGLYLSGGVKAAAGIIFLVWARACHRPWIIILIGIAAIIGGTAVFLAPKSKFQSMFDFILRRPLWLYRLWGLLVVTVGILIIWAGWLG